MRHPPSARSETSSVSSMPGITPEEFERFRDLLLKETGICLNDSKRQLVASRLMKRLRHHGFQSYREYYRFLMEEDPQGHERLQMINCLTTNKTDFFREPHHFDMLRNQVVPQLQERAKRTGARRIRVWSAACSTGEEPYTIAITLKEALGMLTGWDIRILATDIDTEVLEKASSGIYSNDRLEGLPTAQQHKHFLRGKGAWEGYTRIKPELQSLITFRRLNFMDAEWPIATRFDVIFCRNVLIYFNRETQRRIVERLTEYLEPEGLLMIGHSETLHWISDKLIPLKGTVYRRRGGEETSSRPSQPHRDDPAGSGSRRIRPAGMARPANGVQRSTTDRPSPSPVSAPADLPASAVRRLLAGSVSLLRGEAESSPPATGEGPGADSTCRLDRPQVHPAAPADGVDAGGRQVLPRPPSGVDTRPREDRIGSLVRGLAQTGRALLCGNRSIAPEEGDSLQVRRLNIGDVVASRSPVLLSTVLGSCISTCLFDPVTHVGGMNHFMLPDGDEESSSRYGIQALEALIRQIVKLGGDRRRLTAKAFGGGHVLEGVSPTVPQDNIRFIEAYLSREGIPLVGSCLGGSQPREVRFCTATGRAMVRKLSRLHETESADLDARDLFLVVSR